LDNERRKKYAPTTIFFPIATTSEFFGIVVASALLPLFPKREPARRVPRSVESIEGGDDDVGRLPVVIATASPSSSRMRTTTNDDDDDEPRHRDNTLPLAKALVVIRFVVVPALPPIALPFEGDDDDDDDDGSRLSSSADGDGTSVIATSEP
jgi:hypothetical protein